MPILVALHSEHLASWKM